MSMGAKSKKIIVLIVVESMLLPSLASTAAEPVRIAAHPAVMLAPHVVIDTAAAQATMLQLLSARRNNPETSVQTPGKGSPARKKERVAPGKLITKKKVNSVFAVLEECRKIILTKMFMIPPLERVDDFMPRSGRLCLPRDSRSWSGCGAYSEGLKTGPNSVFTAMWKRAVPATFRENKTVANRPGIMKTRCNGWESGMRLRGNETVRRTVAQEADIVAEIIGTMPAPPEEHNESVSDGTLAAAARSIFSDDVRESADTSKRKDRQKI